MNQMTWNHLVFIHWALIALYTIFSGFLAYDIAQKMQFYTFWLLMLSNVCIFVNLFIAFFYRKKANSSVKKPVIKVKWWEEGF